jgi:hypothetical protein
VVTICNCLQADFLIEKFPLISYFWVNKNGVWQMTNNQTEHKSQKAQIPSTTPAHGSWSMPFKTETPLQHSFQRGFAVSAMQKRIVIRKMTLWKIENLSAVQANWTRLWNSVIKQFKACMIRPRTNRSLCKQATICWGYKNKRWNIILFYIKTNTIYMLPSVYMVFFTYKVY